MQVEQRNPTMGPAAKLDIVEFASEAGGPELQIYQRVLTDKGMTITFKRL